MHNCLKIYLIKYFTCFRQVHSLSSGVSQHSIHAVGICHASSVGCMLLASQRKVGYFVLEGVLRARNICFRHVPCSVFDFLIIQAKPAIQRQIPQDLSPSFLKFSNQHHQCGLVCVLNTLFLRTAFMGPFHVLLLIFFLFQIPTFKFV